MILTPTGNILNKDIDLFDENDRLRVTIVADTRLFPLLKVRRASTFRNKSVVRIVGAGTQLPAATDQLIRQAEEKPTVGKKDFIVQDFEPGKGVVEILVIGDPDRTLGTFEFNVNPLYTGIFSFGGVWTQAVNPEYKLVTSGGDEPQNILIEGNTGDRDFLYALLYTPYIWGKRDIEKKIPLTKFWRHFNPTVGVVLNDLDSHALLGLNLGLPNGFLLTGGVHVRRVEVLTDDTNAEVGKPFMTTGNIDDVKLPTSDDWKSEWFFSASIDLRAAVSLITTAVGRAAGN